MAIRPFKLPGDLDTLIEVLPRAFQYPEHPEWGVQQEDMENMRDGFRSAKRMWPVLAVLSAVSPSLRQMLTGYVWEEDGAIIGVANIFRQGSTPRGYIANVAVLPEHRRKGIARKLTEACVDHARKRGDKTVTLDVIAENLPALQLYEKLGFETFASRHDLEYKRDHPVSAPPPLPDGYTMRVLPPHDWHARYALDQAIKPADTQKYQPVEVGAYRMPLLMQPIMRAMTRASGNPEQFALYHGETLVARGRCFMRSKPGGTNGLGLTLHPDHAALAPWLIQYSLHRINTESPGRRIDLSLPAWQQPLTEAAIAAGFVPTTHMVTMGMAF
jgi:ribosomal protein S18 acetylase RimI-like enzyme